MLQIMDFVFQDPHVTRAGVTEGDGRIRTWYKLHKAGISPHKLAFMYIVHSKSAGIAGDAGVWWAQTIGHRPQTPPLAVQCSGNSDRAIINLGFTIAETEVSFWRSFVHSLPGECPCGIRRQACPYHNV